MYGNVFADTPYDREQNPAYPLHSCSAKTPETIVVNAKANFENIVRINQPHFRRVCCFKAVSVVGGGAVVGFGYKRLEILIHERLPSRRVAKKRKVPWRLCPRPCGGESYHPNLGINSEERQYPAN